jgi:hypothetical protein
MVSVASSSCSSTIVAGGLDVDALSFSERGILVTKRHNTVLCYIRYIRRQVSLSRCMVFGV